MPDNNILLFDQNKSNIMSDQNYSTNVQRLNGVQQGIASSQLQNKVLYQTSLVAYALAQLMNANGYDATDADQVSTFASNMSLSIMQKVLDKATSAEAQAGVATGKWVSPATMKAACLFLSGGTMTGDIAMGGNKVTGLAAPVNAGDAVNKQYVDTLHQVVEVIPMKFYEGDVISPKTYPSKNNVGYFRDFDVTLRYPINIVNYDVIRIKAQVFGAYLVGANAANAISLEGYLLDAEDISMNQFVKFEQTDNESLTFPLSVRSETVYHKNENGIFEYSCTKYDRIPKYESGTHVPRFKPKWETMEIRHGGMSTGTISKIRLQRVNTQYPLQTFGAVVEIDAIKYANI